jgi:hypothetical protein
MLPVYCPTLEVPLELDPRTLPDLLTLRQTLVFVTQLRGVQQPLTTPAGLIATVRILLRLAQLSGVDESWRQRLRKVEREESVQHIVLGLLRFLLGEAGEELTGGNLRVELTGGELVELSPETIARWLPLAIQLIQLLRTGRGQI